MSATSPIHPPFFKEYGNRILGSLCHRLSGPGNNGAVTKVVESKMAEYFKRLALPRCFACARKENLLPTTVFLSSDFMRTG